MHQSDKLTQFYWVVSIICFMPAVFLIVMNWGIWNFNRKNRDNGESSSWVPLLGGVLCAASLWIVPIPQAKAFWWIPLILDYGCLIGLTDTAIFWRQYYKQQVRENENTNR